MSFESRDQWSSERGFPSSAGRRPRGGLDPPSARGCGQASGWSPTREGTLEVVLGPHGSGSRSLALCCWSSGTTFGVCSGPVRCGELRVTSVTPAAAPQGPWVSWRQGCLGLHGATRSTCPGICGAWPSPGPRLPSLLLLPVQSASCQPQAPVFSLMIKWDDGALAGVLVRGGHSH